MKRLMVLVLCLNLTQGLWAAEVSAPIQAQIFVQGFEELTNLQIIPPQLLDSAEEACKDLRNIKTKIHNVAIKAQHTGFKAQYKKMLTHNEDEYRSLLESLISVNNLRWTAYLRKKFGEKNPFSYDPEVTLKPIIEGENFPNKDFAFVMTALFPVRHASRTERTITVYGFFHGMILEIDAIDHKLQLSPEQTQYFTDLMAKLHRNLDEAISITTKEVEDYNILKEIAVSEIINTDKCCFEVAQKNWEVAKQGVNADEEALLNEAKAQYEAQVQKIRAKTALSLTKIQDEGATYNSKRERCISELIESINGEPVLTKETIEKLKISVIKLEKK